MTDPKPTSGHDPVEPGARTGWSPGRSPARVITLSREYGAGGIDVGRRLSERLGIDFVDENLVDEVARRLRCSAEAVEQWDERGESLILRLLRALRSAHPEYATPGPVGQEVFDAAPHPDRVAKVVREVIQEEASVRSCVIVGRGGAFILASREDVVHVRLVAEEEDRIQRITKRLGLSPEDARRRVEQADRDRKAYIKHYFGRDLTDPHHFALVLNTSHLSIEDAVDSIVQVSGMQPSSAT